MLRHEAAQTAFLSQILLLIRNKIVCEISETEVEQISEHYKNSL